MNKKLNTILALSALACSCVLISGCANKTKIDEYEQNGCTIKVTYDANGGKYLDREGISVMDMFNPSNYKKEEDGTVHIKLLEPTDPARPVGASGNLYLTKSDYFLAGWYEEREIVLIDGKVVNDDGEELEEKDGSYYLKGTDTLSTPAYEYSGYWDFKKDTVDYKEGDEKVEMTLYAGWVPYYTFEYYAQKDGQWEIISTTSFDYKTTNSENSTSYDYDTIHLPEWQDGAMKYEFKHNDNTPSNFPKVDGTTFYKAFTDIECKNEITTSKFTHQGTLDLAHGKAIDRVQKIYLQLEEGERYKISKASQLSANGNVNGYYEILNDLDFAEEDVEWPAALITGKFKGKMYSSDGTIRKIKNATATFASATATSGGFFGTIESGAEIKNISFENATFDISAVRARLRNGMFGSFSGNIDEKATIENVSFEGSMKIGPVSWTDCDVNLVANGKTDGVKSGDIKLFVYGAELLDVYNFTIDVTDPECVTVDKYGDLTIKFVSSKRLENKIYEIKYNK